VPPGPAKKNRQALEIALDDGMAGSLSDPAILRQRRIVPAAVEITRATSWTGPIPPPADLARYERTLAGLADRLVSIAERESEHRRVLQLRAVRLSELGLATAFVITMTALLSGTWLVHQGRSTEGMGSIILAISSLVLVFLTRGRSQGKKAPAEQEGQGG
jgi:uncharacterized membrane protein